MEREARLRRPPQRLRDADEHAAASTEAVAAVRTKRARSEPPGNEHSLGSIGNLVDLLRERNKLDEARAVLGNAVVVAGEVLGANHMRTLIIEAQAAHLAHAAAPTDPAGTAQLRDVVARMEETLGASHPQTAKYAAALRDLT